eukprot:gene5769-1170_t
MLRRTLLSLTVSVALSARPGLTVLAPSAMPPAKTAKAGPFDYPGSGFASFSAGSRGGLGYPPIPLDGYPTMMMNRSTVAYFLGNDTGLNSAAENMAQARFGIVGLGWQLAMRNKETPWQHLEQWEVVTSAAIKAINPDAKVLVSRNVETSGIQWDHCRPYFLDFEFARKSSLWVVGQLGARGSPRCDAGMLCNGSWGCGNCGPLMPFDGYPGIPYGQLKFNWSSPNLTAWWLQHHLLAAVANRTTRPKAVIDGVHFDCECGNDNGIAPEKMQSFNAAAVAGFGEHLPLFAQHKKMSIAWTGERIRKSKCGTDMARLRNIYTDDAKQTFQLVYDNDITDFNQTLAAFLILRGEHALFEFGVIGPYECASEPCGCDKNSLPDQQCPKPGHYPGGGYGPYRWSPLLDVDYGVPVSAPVVDGSSWSRRWSHAHISLDCASWQATITVIPTPAVHGALGAEFRRALSGAFVPLCFDGISQELLALLDLQQHRGPDV